MNKILILFAISIIIVTGLTGVVKPKIYKPVRFAAANMGLENVSQEIVNTKSPIVEDNQVIVEEVVVKPQLQKVQTISKTVKIQPQKEQVKTQSVKVVPQKNQTLQKTLKKQSTPAQTVSKSQKPVQLPKSVQDIVSKESEKNIENQKPITVVKKTEPAINIPKQEEPKTVLTEEEEVILLNKWRSDLQNQVMRDARVAAPMGTRFRFSFTVDKFGNISNLRVWSDTPYFTPMAVSGIKPVLLSYQGKNILKFPKGTKRIQTNVTGGFVISTYDKYSRPDDYADVEKIRRLKNVQM